MVGKIEFTQVLATFQKVRWVQSPKELTLSVLEDVSRGLSTSGYPTRWQEVQGTAADLQATASAADPSGIRCFDDKMLERFAAAIVALGIRDSNFACL